MKLTMKSRLAEESGQELIDQARRMESHGAPQSICRAFPPDGFAHGSRPPPSGKSQSAFHRFVRTTQSGQSFLLLLDAIDVLKSASNGLCHYRGYGRFGPRGCPGQFGCGRSLVAHHPVAERFGKRI